MADRFVELPFLKSIGLMMTFRCQVSCPHCIVRAGPDRKEEMRVEDACDWVRQIAAYRNGHIRIVALTGGEPFYNLPTLRTVSDGVAASKLLPSVVTNAFWATSEEKAIRTLRELPAIKILSISTDIYHQMSIPLERIKYATRAADACGIAYSISVCTENESSEGYKRIVREIQEFVPKELILTAIALPVGRALKGLRQAKYDITDEVPISACATGNSPVIFPDGRVIGCIGPVIDLPPTHPIVLGNLRHNSLSEILDEAQTNTILHAIRVWGPKKLIAMLKDAGLGDYVPTRYIKDSVCDACYKLMTDGRVVAFLNRLALDAELKRQVAYGRAYYLKEPEMVEFLKLSESAGTA